jgi:hypothetical protein
MQRIKQMCRKTRWHLIHLVPDHTIIHKSDKAV